MTSPSTHLVLYCNNTCPFSSRAMIAMAETKQEHEEIFIDLKTPRPDWYTHINPSGQVLALKVDDHHVLTESLIVAEFIADLHPECGLIALDPLQRAQSRLLIHHYATFTQKAFETAAFTTSSPSEAPQRHQAWIDQLEKLDQILRDAHQPLAPAHQQDGHVGGPFFLGNRFTFADMVLSTFLVRVPLMDHFQKPLGFMGLEALKKENLKLKRVFEWMEAIVARESVKKVLPTREELVEVYAANLK